MQCFSFIFLMVFSTVICAQSTSTKATYSDKGADITGQFAKEGNELFFYLKVTDENFGVQLSLYEKEAIILDYTKRYKINGRHKILRIRLGENLRIRDLSIKLLVRSSNRARSKLYRVFYGKDYVSTTNLPLLRAVGNGFVPALTSIVDTSKSYKIASQEPVKITYFGHSCRANTPLWCNKKRTNQQDKAAWVMDVPGNSVFKFKKEGRYRVERAQDKKAYYVYCLLPTDSMYFNAQCYLTKNRESEVDEVAFWEALNFNKSVKSRDYKMTVQQDLLEERVRKSNLYFSDTKVGWQTDRGMLFITAGMPDLVDREGRKEIWTYRYRKGRNPAIFEFEQEEGTFYLVRDHWMFQFWQMSMKFWRRLW